MHTLHSTIDACTANPTEDAATIRANLYTALNLHLPRTLKPMPLHYICRRFDPPAMDGAIHLPQSHRRAPCRGVILISGADTTLKPGTEVIFPPIAGIEYQPIDNDGPPLFIYHRDEIIATLEPAVPDLPESQVDELHGDLMSLSDFRGGVECSGFTNDDGSGYFARDGKWSREYPVDCSRFEPPEWATQVIWFSK